MRSLPLVFVLGLILPSTAATQPPEIRRIVTASGDTLVTTSYAPATARSTDARPTVILIPGLLGGAYTYRKLAPALSEAGHRVVIIEPLGVGASARPKEGDYSLEAQATRVGHALDSLRIANATFVCHSVGASICFRLALERPELTRGVISVNGGPDESAGTSGLRASLRLAPLLKLFGAQHIIKGKVKNGLRDNSADPSWVTDAVIAGYTAPFANFDAVITAFRGMVNAHERAALKPRLSQISVPVTIMVGAGKPEGGISPGDLKILMQSVPHIRVDSVAGTGQYIQEEKPEAIVQAVRVQQGGH